jgi:sRNA-binding carbon storage regulator CsrA
MAVERHDTHTPTLAEMGLTRDESSRYQQLAAMPAEHFETAVFSFAHHVLRLVNQLAAHSYGLGRMFAGAACVTLGRIRPRVSALHPGEHPFLGPNRMPRLQLRASHGQLRLGQLAPRQVMVARHAPHVLRLVNQLAAHSYGLGCVVAGGAVVLLWRIRHSCPACLVVLRSQHAFLRPDRMPRLQLRAGHGQLRLGQLAPRQVMVARHAPHVLRLVNQLAADADGLGRVVAGAAIVNRCGRIRHNLSAALAARL